MSSEQHEYRVSWLTWDEQRVTTGWEDSLEKVEGWYWGIMSVEKWKEMFIERSDEMIKACPNCEWVEK